MQIGDLLGREEAPSTAQTPSRRGGPLCRDRWPPRTKGGLIGGKEAPMQIRGPLGREEAPCTVQSFLGGEEALSIQIGGPLGKEEVL